MKTSRQPRSRRFDGAAILASALLSLLVAGPAGAQQLDDVHCQATPEMERNLERRFGATRQGAGIRSPDEVMELWSDRGGDWALVARYATGRSCIVAVGAHWEGAPPGG